MAKPTTLPEWASSASAGITEPSTLQKQSGWAARQKPPAQYLNWWQKVVYSWIQYVDGLTSETLTWAAKHTFNAGLATPTAPTAGNDVANKTYADGLITSLKASLNTWTQKQTFNAGLATPTAPTTGNDVPNKTYADGLITSLKASLNTWTATQTFGAGQDVMGTATITGTTTRAPLTLVPQGAPSTPVDGDLWVDSGDGTFKARVNNATQTLASQAYVAGLNGFRMTQHQTIVSYGNTSYNILSVPPAAIQALNFSNQAGTYNYQVPASGWYRLHLYAQGISLMEAGTNITFNFGKNGTALSGVEAPAVVVYQASGGNLVYTNESFVSLVQGDILHMMVKFSNTTTGWSGIARFGAERVS